MKVSNDPLPNVEVSHLTLVLIHGSITGNIASIVTQAHFKARFGLDTQSEDEYANTKGWLVSIATAGAVFGCLGVRCFRYKSTDGSTILIQLSI